MEPEQEGTQEPEGAVQPQFANSPPSPASSLDSPGGPLASQQIPPVLPPDRPKRRLKRIVLIAVFAVFTGLIVLFAMRLFGGITLVAYDDVNYSLHVPKGYEQIRDIATIRFQERTGNDSSRSFVVVLTQFYPDPVDENDIQRLIDLYEREIPQLVGLSSNPGQKVENANSQRIIHRERDALRVTADLVKDDRRAKLDMLVVFGDLGVYMVGVAAHPEDKNLSRASNRIITSLALYE